MREYNQYCDGEKKVRENREYYALRGTGEKIQRVW
jgi:hypothetical protein